MDKVLIKDKDECWCGSGKEYASCHKEFDQKLIEARNAGYLNKEEIFSKEYNPLNSTKMENLILNLKKCELTQESSIIFKIE